MAVNRLGKWLYGVTFALLLPVALVAWARATSETVRLPMAASRPLGLPIAAIGATLLLLGMAHLWVYGGGLPMNAFPPPRYVERGIYRFMPHPIYVGSSMLCAGVSMAAGSSSGFWLVSPVVALACAALVLGYERYDLVERLGRAPRAVLPQAGLSPPSASDRLACYIFVLLPWVALYEAVIALGLPGGAATAQLAFEQRLPVLEWSEVFYFSAYIGTALAPLFARTRGDLRTFCLRGLWSMVVAFPLYLALPLAAPQRPFVPHTPLGRLLAWERTLDNPAGAFPSFHVIWAVLAAEVFARRWPRAAWAWRGWAILVAAACVTAGQHPIADVLAGFGTVWLVARGPVLWEVVRARGERLANSWREWRIGPLRIINHGIYAGAGAFLAVSVASTLAGPGQQVPIFTAALAAVVGAALWAQWIEGSTQLLRPFGFYGGVLGVALGALAAPLFGASTWLVLAAFAAGGPWAQAMGRLRCLVQGCCHGRPAPEYIGIRYTHPRSRVCRLTGWKGVPLHPTPIYSILWNVLVALAVTRLWLVHAPLHLIAGLYCILTGLGRFVEEALRGEPQTPVWAGLRLYQWVAIASVLAGALMTALGASAPAPAAQMNWHTLPAAAALGLAVVFAMGVDFPDSQQRFSRLA
ncbi:MAG TPA: prolipoprotein diacylglyceryl transferase family protein [Bryobacteraceae bacterium]|nr:prolipoprotein diacylglyceryl transferase family protein [Bryobacteraceae bacterium]